MKSLRSYIAVAALACLSLAAFASFDASPANAAVALVAERGAFPQNTKVIAYGDVTASSTFATASYADLAGSSITYTPSLNDCTTAARLTACIIEVSWNIDGSKATATTGTCAVFVNGAVVASSARSLSSSGGNENIGGDFMFANTTVGAQTIKLQCKSGDTNTFTVNFGHVVVREIIPAAAH